MLDGRAVHAAAHAVKLIGHGVFAAQEGGHPLGGERVVLGAEHHAEGVHRPGHELRRNGPLVQVGVTGHRGAQAQRIPFLQLAALKAADGGLHVGGAAAHYEGDVQPARKGDVGPAARSGRPEAQGLPGLYGQRGVGGHGLAVHRGRKVAAGDGNDLVRLKFQLRPHEGALQHGFPLGVAHQNVADGGGPGVHHAGDRHAELLVAHPAQILHGGQQAGVQHGNAHCASSSLAWQRQV